MSINANPHAGTVLIVPNVEAVQEFQVITNNPSAEHGRNLGASVNLVTRRGTNQFSGSAFQLYRNEALRSKNVFETQKPEFTRNNFGFSLGGPVMREQTASGEVYAALRSGFDTIFDPVPIVYTMGPAYPQNAALAAGLDDRGGIRGARISLTALDPKWKRRTRTTGSWACNGNCPGASSSTRATLAPPDAS
jgi:hypothetical protein